MLEHFAFLSVPAGDAERIADAVDGERVRGRELRVEPAKVEVCRQDRNQDVPKAVLGMVRNCR